MENDEKRKIFIRIGIFLASFQVVFGSVSIYIDNGKYKTITTNKGIELQRSYTNEGIIAFLTWGKYGDQEPNGNFTYKIGENCRTGAFKNKYKEIFEVETDNNNKPILQQKLSIFCKENTQQNVKEATNKLLQYHHSKNSDDKF